MERDIEGLIWPDIQPQTFVAQLKPASLSSLATRLQRRLPQRYNELHFTQSRSSAGQAESIRIYSSPCCEL